MHIDLKTTAMICLHMKNIFFTIEMKNYEVGMD